MNVVRSKKSSVVVYLQWPEERAAPSVLNDPSVADYISDPAAVLSLSDKCRNFLRFLYVF